MTQPASGTTHRIGDGAIHTYFDNSLAPALTIQPGDTVVFDTREPSNGGTARRVAAEPPADLDPDFAALIAAAARPEVATPLRGHALTGPVFIAGAEPGDALDVTVVAVQPAAWGWTGVGPGNLLLGDLFPEWTTHYWDLRAGDYAPFGPVSASRSRRSAA